MVGSEQELLERARQLDARALGDIYDLYSPALYRYAVRLLGCADLAEECVAEVFGRLLHSLSAGKGPKDYLQAYLYRVAHNWITDQWRRQPPAAVELEPSRYADEGIDPSQSLVEQMERAQVRAALAKLTPDQRQVVVLKYLEGMENEQIAAALGKPVGAVKSLQHRGVAALRRALLGEEESYELV